MVKDPFTSTRAGYRSRIMSRWGKAMSECPLNSSKIQFCSPDIHRANSSGSKNECFKEHHSAIALPYKIFQYPWSQSERVPQED